MEKNLAELMVISIPLFSLNKRQEENFLSIHVRDSDGSTLCR